MVDNTQPTITLTEKERALFATLSKAVKECNLNTTIRVNGGWVRDKVRICVFTILFQIMGLESDDIDLSIDEMYGEEFAKHLTQNLNKDGGQEKVSYKIIKNASENAKHLETATVIIDGMLIDIVNLRSETYTEHSRHPIIEMGTPT